MFQRPPREPEWASWAYFFLGALTILLTIPLTRTIQNWVANRWGSEAFTRFVIGSVVAALVFAGFQMVRHPSGLNLRRGFWLLAVAGTYAGWTVHLGRGSPEEAVHFLEYGGLSLLGFRALAHRLRDQGIFIAAALLCALVGTADEVLQWLIPGRFWDFADVGLNASSGALMQVALWGGLPPAFLGNGIGAPSIRLISRLGTAQLLLLGLCFSNTPARIVWLSRQAPFLAGLARMDDVMVEYGYRYVDPEIGVFFSRFAPDHLRETDARRGEEAARILDGYREEGRYGEFLKRFSPLTDPFVHEARVHMFRRDRFLGRAFEPGVDQRFRTEHCTVAQRENRILEKYFPRTLQSSSFVLPESASSFMNANLDRERPYTSRVSDTLLCRIREWQIWAVILVMTAALLLLERRSASEGSLLVGSSGRRAEAG